MAKPSFDIRKMFLASVVIIGIGVILSVISIIFQMVPAVTPAEYLDIINLVDLAYTFLLYPIFFALFLWAGMRAAKNFGFDLVGAGIVSAFSYVVIALVNLAVSILLQMIILSRPVSNVGFGSIESVLSSILFSDASGITGVGLSSLCGVGLIIIGALINFVVGGFGGWIVLRRKF